MQVNTSDLTDLALDWAVAEAEYQESPPLKSWVLVLHKEGQVTYPYSTAWDWGGPIIEREKITIEWTGENWMAYIRHDEECFGPTPLIAAMRCYVSATLVSNHDPFRPSIGGDSIEIPDELME